MSTSAIASTVVEVSEIADSIVQIRMQDRINKNTFSQGITQGLISGFAAISANENYKVAILTGYDSYFSSGGTQEALLQLHEGQGKFSDRDLYSLSLHCPIPVISAMQGHGIGGGFVLGLFADLVVLSRESIYSTNFMKYGFTPGMGATYILPRKLGCTLATEMLFSAGRYRGGELEQRGITFPVLPRSEVLEHAMKLAKVIASVPRCSLVTLKDHTVKEMRDELPGFIEAELKMHDKTFHSPEVEERIRTVFGS